MSDYYFTGQNYKSFFYFYYGKIIETNIKFYIIDGINYNNGSWKRGEFKVPKRFDLKDNPDQYDLNKDEAQKGVIRLILGEEE